jgi:hypothetical protein
MKPWLEMVLSPGQIECPKCVWLLTKWESRKRFQGGLETSLRKRRASWAAVSGSAPHGRAQYDTRADVPEKIAMQISGHKTASMLWRYNITDARDIKDAGKRTERYLEAQRGHQDAHIPRH